MKNQDNQMAYFNYLFEEHPSWTPVDVKIYYYFLLLLIILINI